MVVLFKTKTRWVSTGGHGSAVPYFAFYMGAGCSGCSSYFDVTGIGPDLANSRKATLPDHVTL